LGQAFAIAYAQSGADRIAVGSRSGDASGTVAAVKQAAKEAGHAEPFVLQVRIDVWYVYLFFFSS